MQRTITVSADDFGLTRSITDAILETVDAGAVQSVSVLANGEAVSYALAEYQKRSSSVALAVHINLTEGKALSAPQDIPHLVDTRGYFVHSVARLWLTYLFASRATRNTLRVEVRKEMSRQLDVIRSLLGAQPLAINGHQHVHMIPFIFEELVGIEGIHAIRIVREKFFFSGIPSPVNMLARYVLAGLSARALSLCHARGILTNDWFVGLLYAGRMNEQRVRAGIASVGEGSIEVLLHPGSAREGELEEWREGGANIAWHTSIFRTHERDMLLMHGDSLHRRGGRTWEDFWNAKNPIYASDRHIRAHYDAIAHDVLRILPMQRPLTLLDYGCGDALSSFAFVESGITVLLHDPVPLVHERIQKRFADTKQVSVIKDIGRVENNSVDVILISSVLQYLSKDEWESVLRSLRRLLRPGGCVIVADVVSTKTTVRDDIHRLLINAYRHKYVLSALQSLFRLHVSDYASIRKEQGFSQYSEEEILLSFQRAGFTARKEKHNIGMTPHRMTFVAYMV